MADPSGRRRRRERTPRSRAGPRETACRPSPRGGDDDLPERRGADFAAVSSVFDGGDAIPYRVVIAELLEPRSLLDVGAKLERDGISELRESMDEERRASPTPAAARLTTRRSPRGSAYASSKSGSWRFTRLASKSQDEEFRPPENLPNPSDSYSHRRVDGEYEPSEPRAGSHLVTQPAIKYAAHG